MDEELSELRRKYHLNQITNSQLRNKSMSMEVCLLKAVALLHQIANQDFRGNRPPYAHEAQMMVEEITKTMENQLWKEEI